MFERYSEQARRVVFFARYEATFHLADKITTGHLLLGLIREGGSRTDTVRLLKDQEKQLRFALGIPHSSNKPDKAALMWDMPLNDNSKIVLAYAAEEADYDQEYWIDTDHLLRGILRFPNEATAALQSISLDLNKAREASKQNRAEFPSKSPPRFHFFHRRLAIPFRKFFAIPFRRFRRSIKAQIFLAIIVLLFSLLMLWAN
jgi:ATP-dependent Clp protease ATP-binding subunit ClpC